MNDRRSSSADLGASAEAALGGFRFPERDWESDARSVEAQLSGSARGSTDAALLAAALPAEPGEPTSLAATPTPLTTSGVRTQTLTDLARRSVEQKQQSVREMARESLALAAQRPTVDEARALREAVSGVRPVNVAPAAASAAGAAALAPRPPSAAHNPWPRLGLLAGGLALASGVLFWLRQPAPAPAPLIINNAQAAAEAKAPLAAPGAPSPGAASPAATALTGVDPSTLSQEGSAKLAEVAHAKSAGAAVSVAAVSASASGPSPEKVVLEDETPPLPALAPADKVVEKVLPPDPTLRPAESTGGASPVKPSTGAVQAALGSVMSGARHCVAGDDEASSAVVVFASDGRVRSVTVHGPAAGKPAAACIEAQLSRARVQPFASASFSVNATVRPD